MIRSAERRANGTKARNRNAERSIRLLEASFLQLLSKKPYEKITVTDVASAADLNRGTFYAHFESMDALRDHVFAELTTAFSQLIDRVINASFLEDPMPVLTEIGRYLDDNRELLQRLIRSETLEPFINTMQANLRRHIHAYLSDGGTEDSPTTLAVADYVAYGVLGVYRAWIVGEYGARTVEEVNRDLDALVRGARTAMPNGA